MRARDVFWQEAQRLNEVVAVDTTPDIEMADDNDMEIEIEDTDVEMIDAGNGVQP